MIKDFIRENNIRYKENISLKRYNTYRLDVKCKYIVFPDTYDKIINLIKYLKQNNIKYMFLGNGSNTIFKCHKYDGVIIKLDELNSIKIENNHITVGAGCLLLKLAATTINEGLSGLEFAGAIPGEVGASTCMNAGAYNESMSDVVTRVMAIDSDLNISVFTNEQMEFSYRSSLFKNNPEFVIVEVEMDLKPGDKQEMHEVVKRRIIKRKESQPLEYPSAGSVFRNPEGMYAGSLIERLGLKGYTIGGAQVSLKHANFIINTGNATGDDIVKLIEYIRNRVKEAYDIDLILEQIIIE